jgi:hypothetical protein
MSRAVIALWHGLQLAIGVHPTQDTAALTKQLPRLPWLDSLVFRRRRQPPSGLWPGLSALFRKGLALAFGIDTTQAAEMFARDALIASLDIFDIAVEEDRLAERLSFLYGTGFRDVGTIRHLNRLLGRGWQQELGHEAADRVMLNLLQHQIVFVHVGPQPNDSSVFARR